MDDKQLMENILNLEKGACDLYLHGNLESEDQAVHSAFNAALTNSVSMQKEIYDKMEQKGWYQNEQAEKQKITQVKRKFSKN